MKKLHFMITTCLVLLMSNATGAQTNGIIESTSGVPTTATDGYNKGFYPDNTDSTPNPSFIKCAGGDMGSQAGGGYNCLIQVDQSDQHGYAFGIFMKNGTQDAFPYFRVRKTGTTIMDAFNNQPNYVNTFYYTPYIFGDPTDTYEEACTVCLTTNQNITAQNTSSVLAIYGTPTNIFPSVLPLQRGYGNTTANKGTGRQVGTLVYQMGDEGHLHYGGAYGSGALIVSTCGTGSPKIAGADGAFVITLDTGTPTSCTVMFHAIWTSTDLTCTFISDSDLVNWKFAKVGSVNAWTGVTLTASAPLTNASKIHGLCVGHV